MIASWSQKKAEAAKYISYATSSKVMQNFVENQGQPARSSALNDPENVKIGSYFPTLQKVLAQGHPFPAIPKSYQFLVELGNHVAEILTKQTTPSRVCRRPTTPLPNAEGGGLSLTRPCAAAAHELADRGNHNRDTRRSQVFHQHLEQLAVLSSCRQSSSSFSSSSCRPSSW